MGYMRHHGIVVTGMEYGDHYPESDAGDKRRSAFKAWLRSPPDGVYVDWAEVQYGDDEHDNRVTAASGGVGQSEPKANKPESPDGGR